LTTICERCTTSLISEPLRVIKITLKATASKFRSKRSNNEAISRAVTKQVSQSNRKYLTTSRIPITMAVNISKRHMAKGILVRNDVLDRTGDTVRSDDIDQINLLEEDPTAASDTSSSDEDQIQGRKQRALQSSNVRFSTIQIREYPITIGLNPSTEFGPALELGWEYSQTEDVSVDCFEEERSIVPRRGEEDLVLSSYEREERLLALGYSMRQIWNKTHEKDSHRMGAQRSKRKNTLIKLKNAVMSMGADRRRTAIIKKNTKMMKEQIVGREAKSAKSLKPS